MSVWMEIMCDVRKDGANKSLIHARCHSHRGDSPGALAENSQAAVRATLRQLSKHAKANGWINNRGGWCCPGCANETLEAVDA